MNTDPNMLHTAAAALRDPSQRATPPKVARTLADWLDAQSRTEDAPELDVPAYFVAEAVMDALGRDV